MEKVDCNYCGSKNSQIYCQNIKSPDFDERFKLVKCLKCGLIYLNPRPSSKNIDKYYSTQNYFSRASNALMAYSFIYRLIFSKIKKGSIFDVGAGTGLFLTEFKKRGWKIDGLEPSKKGREIAKKKFGINLRAKDFLKEKIGEEKYDLVVFNNVIEHLYKPKETLRKSFKSIKKGGFILISCPNVYSIGATIFEHKWYAMDAPRHLYQFNFDTLSKMLESCGFEIADVSYNYYKENYMTLFESFRRTFSPRFSEKINVDGSIQKNKKVKSKQSIFKKTGIIFCRILSSAIAFAEPLIGHGELITILAFRPL